MGDSVLIRADRGAEILDRAAEKFKRAGPRFPRVWIDDAKTDLTITDLIKGVIGRKLLILVYGPSGGGKTFFVIDTVSHIACAQRWRNRRVNQCAVAYVAAEAGASIVRRFVPWRDRHLSEAREERSPLAIITRGADLLNDLDVEALVVELRSIGAEAGMPVGVVVFDTAMRSMPGGDDNAAADMTKLVATCDLLRDELGITCIVVHHTGKDEKKGSRGHSSLAAAADTIISVVDRCATIEKQRDGMTGEQFAFDLEVVKLGEDEDGDPITTCLVVPIRAAPPKSPQQRPLSGVAKVALQALQEAVSDHGKVMPESSTMPAGVRAVRIDQWRAQFTVRYGSDGGDKRDAEAVRKAFQRAREALLKESAIGISDPYAWVTKRSKSIAMEIL